MVDDPTMPLAEHLRFLAISARNLDEFYVVRIGRLKHAAAGAASEEGTGDIPRHLPLDALAVRVMALVARQQHLFHDVLQPELAAAGVRSRARIESLGFPLAVVVKDRGGGRAHLAHLPIPGGVPRFLTAPRTRSSANGGLIVREIDLARSGRLGRIRAKLKGSANAGVVRALYGASRSGMSTTSAPPTGSP